MVDIGPGCSELPELLINYCEDHNHSLVLIDSEEMLRHLPDKPGVLKVPAMYPNCPQVIGELKEGVDAILCYSVLQYVLLDVAFFRFLDSSLSLLAPGGQFLIGDIPNISKRKRFFSSKAGILFHQEFMGTVEPPVVTFNDIEHDQIDDSIIYMIINRARLQGFDAYILPQHPDLPMSNRREDVLIVRP